MTNAYICLKKHFCKNQTLLSTFQLNTDYYTVDMYVRKDKSSKARLTFKRRSNFFFFFFNELQLVKKQMKII